MMAIATAAFVLAPLAATAQSGRTTIVVGAGDATTGAFLPGVQVRIASLKMAQVTDSMGQTRLTGIGDGTYVIEARRVGYAPLSAPVLVHREDSVEVVLLLRAKATQLDTMLVTSSEVSAHLREFEERRVRGVGQFVTAAQIDSVPGSTLQALLEGKVHGVTATGQTAGGLHVVSGRMSTNDALRPGSGGVAPCWPVVYLDGAQLVDDTGRGPDIGFINLVSIGGIEYYAPSEVPPQYRGNGPLQNGAALGRSAQVTSRGTLNGIGGESSPSCGVMLIWSRG
jgi:hypothetical protein